MKKILFYSYIFNFLKRIMFFFLLVTFLYLSRTMTSRNMCESCTSWTMTFAPIVLSHPSTRPAAFPVCLLHVTLCSCTSVSNMAHDCNSGWLLSAALIAGRRPQTCDGGCLGSEACWSSRWMEAPQLCSKHTQALQCSLPLPPTI